MIISEFEARLAVVPRWCVVHTIQKQSVAEHSFYVALIAPRIAKEWYGVISAPPEWWVKMNRYALLHDQLEAYSGDVAGMVKDLFNDDKLFHRYEEVITEYPARDDTIKDVVKCADLYERCFFMATELAMGNRSMQVVCRDNIEQLVDHMNATGAADFVGEASTQLFKRGMFTTRTMDLRPK